MDGKFDYQDGFFIHDRWRIERLINNARTKVYLATDVKAEERVVLRFPDPKGKSAAIEQSVRANSVPRHDNVCYLFEVRSIDDWPMQVFEYIPDGTLQDRIDNGEANAAFLVQACLGICDGLIHLYHFGLRFHGDIKPHNCLWSHTMFGPKITDYGEIAFTPGFSAPEFKAGDHDRLDERVDVYSVGKILLLSRVRNSVMDEGLMEVARKASQINPDDRYQSVSDLRNTLELVFSRLTGQPAPERKGPQDPSLGHAMGQSVLYREHGNLPKALEILLDQVEAGRHTEGLFTSIGNVYYRLPDLETACEWFRRALKLNPAFVPALASLCAPGMGTDREREDGLELLIKIDPDFAGIRVSYANLLVSRGEIDEAEIYLEEALDKDPDDVIALLDMGVFYSESKPNAEKAKASFQKVWDIWSQKTWNQDRGVAMGAAAIGMCNWAYKEEDYKALRLWSHLSVEFPTVRAHAMMYQGAAAALTGNPVEAIQFYELVVKEYPEFRDTVNLNLEAIHKKWPDL